MLKLLLALALLTSQAVALTIVGDTTLTAPYSRTDEVRVTGSVTLATPGHYSAAEWRVTGNIKFSAPGTYTVTAVSGGIYTTGNVVGPASGQVTVTVYYASEIQTTGTVSTNITVIDGPNQPLQTGSNSSAPLVNISTRATLAAGQILNPGFVVGGTTPRRVLIRAIGPELARYGVTNSAPSTTLTIFSGQTQIATNSGWGGGASLSAAFSATGAFGLPTDSKDSAIMLTLNPGSYTATITGTGEVLAEVYFVD